MQWITATRYAVASLGLLLISLSANLYAADSRNLGVQNSRVGNRLALVIGNDNYSSVNSLKNARADAQAIAAALTSAGYRVESKFDLNEKGMKAAFRDFKRSLSGGDEAVFFFAGHGVQLGAANYLLPIDIKGDNEDQVKDEAIPLQRILDDIQEQKAKFTLAIIDACRDNPFKGSGRSIGGRGLAPTTAATGQMVIFSAGSGQQALDKLGENDWQTNGLFTRVFVKEMQKPGVPVDRVLKNVRQQVASLASSVKHDQVPALYDQALGEFYFFPGESTQVASIGGGVMGAGRSAAQIEDELWDAIKDSAKANVFEEYMKQYPNGRYLAQARVKIAGLKEAKPTSPQSLPQIGKPVPSNPEDALWTAVEKGNTADDYDAYLSQYPKGKYIALAKQRKQKFHELATQQAQQKEQTSWSEAENGNSIESYTQYINQYPQGQFSALANNRLKKVRDDAATQAALREKAEREAAELNAWKKAEASKDKSPVSAYLNQYPSGKYTVAAKAKLDQIEREEAEMKPGKVIKDCPACPEVIVLAAGSFIMGTDNPFYKHALPLHQVQLHAFAMGKTEVTQAQWRAVMGNNPSEFSGCGDSCPVENVSWIDAQQFVEKLSKITGKTYRLPSSSEWEYACRAGGRHKYCGSDDSDNAWHAGNSGGTTHPVASKQSNSWGLYDMSGNVMEWTQDCWNENYVGAPSDGSAWATGDCGRRVARGGEWRYDKQNGLSGNAGRIPQTAQANMVGFRIARSLP
jgi:formylglycine-generating enzyme required for sulfatase activity